MQISGLTEAELRFAKASMDEYEAPVAPLPPPDPAFFDAAHVDEPPATRGVDLKNATCPACVMRQEKSITVDRTKDWGKLCPGAQAPMAVVRILEADGVLEPPSEDATPEGKNAANVAHNGGIGGRAGLPTSGRADL